MINNQGYLFIIFTLEGVLIGIIFDFFRILRKSFKTKDFVTYIQDIFFWIIVGIIFLYSMYKFCDGELRLFMIIGTILGISIYIVTISRIVIKVTVFILEIIKKILIFPLKIIFRPIGIICINIRKNLRKILEKLVKKRGFFVKKEKYIIER